MAFLAELGKKRKKKLRHTKTKVTNRLGKVVIEDVKSGTTTAAKATAKPKYIKDMEEGIYHRTPRAFQDGRWRDLKPTDQQLNGQESRDAAARIHSKGLTVVTYNVWFSKHRQRERALSLFSILENSDADVICLQEVTPFFLQLLTEQDWMRKRYILSDSIGTSLKGSQLAYGVIIAVKKPTPISMFTLHNLPSRMNRRMLRVSIYAPETVGNHQEKSAVQLVVGTVHLESLDNIALRKDQLSAILPILAREADGGSAMLMGDFNFDPNLFVKKVVDVRAGPSAAAVMRAGSSLPCALDRASVRFCLDLMPRGAPGTIVREHDDHTFDLSSIRPPHTLRTRVAADRLSIPEAKAIPGSWVDAWRAVHPGAEGFTMPRDDHYLRPTRIDRVLLHSARYRPSAIELAGTDPLPPSDPSSTSTDYPSDHFGLKASFTRNGPGDDGVEFYRKNGYLVVRGLLCPAKVRAAQQRLRELTHGVDGQRDLAKEIESLPASERTFSVGLDPKAAPGAKVPGDSIRKIADLVQAEDAFRQICMDEKVLAFVCKVLGPDVKLFRNTVLMKPPGGLEKDVHQDSPYWPILPMDLCSVWIPFDPATKQNGCMRVQPGGHKRGPIKHIGSGDFLYISHDICHPDKDMVQLPMQPGDAVFFHSLVPHYTKENTTDSFRRAITLSYMSSRSTFSTDHLDDPTKFDPKQTFTHVRGRTFEGCVR